MNFSLTPQLELFIRENVANGDYNNASEVVREALRLFKNNHDLRELKLQKLRQAINKGDDAIKKGNVTEIASAKQLDEIFEEI